MYLVPGRKQGTKKTIKEARHTIVVVVVVVVVVVIVIVVVFTLISTYLVKIYSCSSGRPHFRNILLRK